MEIKQEVALAVGKELRKYAIEQGTVPFATGEMRKAHIVIKNGVDGALLSVGRPYAPHVFYGIRGIKPRNAKALRFKAPKGWRGKVSKGGYVFLKSVGPRAPRPWLLVAIRNLKSAGFGFVAQHLRDRIVMELRK